MSASQPVSPCPQRLNPLKRMNYTFGMVLGVDEFRQEQTYFIGKGHSQYRLAHGYGTLCGLDVQVATSPDLEVQVSQGVLVNPQGQEVHVQQLMCARLNDWLSNNQAALHQLLGTPPLAMSLCVVLCYRECPADLVPVPGEPCRSQSDAMAASHIAESFQLQLCLDADQIATSPPVDAAGLCWRPAQVEEDAIRKFGHILRRIRVTGVGPTSITKEMLKNLVRELAPGAAGLLTSPPITSPEDASPIYIAAADAESYMNAMFRVWVTEVRPVLAAQASGGAGGCATAAEQCVLLAELHFNVAKGWQATGAVEIDESRRPYLLETRLLQEFLLQGGFESAVGCGTENAAVVVAGGTFQIVPVNKAVPIGPTLNGLSASFGGSAGTFLLNWSGFPAYTNPLTSSPGTHTYVVKGTALAGAASAAPYVVQLLSFQAGGILIGVQGINNTAPAAGFSVEISEIRLD